MMVGLFRNEKSRKFEFFFLSIISYMLSPSKVSSSLCWLPYKQAFWTVALLKGKESLCEDRAVTLMTGGRLPGFGPRLRHLGSRDPGEVLSLPLSCFLA